MKISPALVKVREDLSGKIKLESRVLDSDYQKEIVDEISSLTDQMNTEKMNALKEIDEKYKDRIYQLQNDYATILRLSA